MYVKITPPHKKKKSCCEYYNEKSGYALTSASYQLGLEKKL